MANVKLKDFDQTRTVYKKRPQESRLDLCNFCLVQKSLSKEIHSQNKKFPTCGDKKNFMETN